MPGELERYKAELAKDKPRRKAIDSKILSNARKSMNEISELTGASPEYVAERLSELLAERGWLSERQEERLLIIEMSDVVSHAREKLEEAKYDNENYASIANAVFKGLELISKRMDARRTLVEEDISRITAANAKLFGHAMDIALSHIRGTLKELYPEVTDQMIDDLAMDGLRIAKKELDESTVAD